MRNWAVGLGFRVCSPYCHGRDCGTPKPGKKKQERYDYAYAVLIIHRFPFSLLLTPVVRKVRPEVMPKAKPSEKRRWHRAIRHHIGIVVFIPSTDHNSASG